MVRGKVYTIKQAAARSGVTVQLLRAWERRYGVVDPARTESGYRLYDDAAIDRFRAMRRLIDDGWKPSTAATRVRELDDAAVRDLLDQAAPAAIAGAAATSGGATSGGASATAAEQLQAAFLASAAKLDEPGFERALDDMFARGSFEHVTSELVMPALVALGDEWANGKLDVAAEHAAAGAVQRRLGMAFMAAGRRGRRSRPCRGRDAARCASRSWRARVRYRTSASRRRGALPGRRPASPGLARCCSADAPGGRGAGRRTRPGRGRSRTRSRRSQGRQPDAFDRVRRPSSQQGRCVRASSPPYGCRRDMVPAVDALRSAMGLRDGRARSRGRQRLTAQAASVSGPSKLSSPGPESGARYVASPSSSGVSRRGIRSSSGRNVDRCRLIHEVDR